MTSDTGTPDLETLLVDHWPDGCGPTWNDLAEHLGITARTIQRGRRGLGLSLATAQTIAWALGLHPRDVRESSRVKPRGRPRRL